MALDFRRVSMSIPSGSGTKTVPGSATFLLPVRRADVALNSFNFDYSSDDHHINIVEAAADVLSIAGNTVNFQVRCQYADKNFDDSYRGNVNVLVIAETP